MSLFSRTDATSYVIVAAYGTFEGEDDAVGVAVPACASREEGTARAIHPAAALRKSLQIEIFIFEPPLATIDVPPWQNVEFLVDQLPGVVDLLGGKLYLRPNFTP
jgi:hypothetical protein